VFGAFLIFQIGRPQDDDQFLPSSRPRSPSLLFPFFPLLRSYGVGASWCAAFLGVIRVAPSPDFLGKPQLIPSIFLTPLPPGLSIQHKKNRPDVFWRVCSRLLPPSFPPTTSVTHFSLIWYFSQVFPSFPHSLSSANEVLMRRSTSYSGEDYFFAFWSVAILVLFAFSFPSHFVIPHPTSSRFPSLAVHLLNGLAAAAFDCFSFLKLFFSLSFPCLPLFFGQASTWRSEGTFTGLRISLSSYDGPLRFFSFCPCCPKTRLENSGFPPTQTVPRPTFLLRRFFPSSFSPPSSSSFFLF